MRSILLLILTAHLISFSQTTYDFYDQHIAEADSLRQHQQFSKAILAYQNALNLLTPNSSTPFFNLAECALELNDFSKADEWIRTGITQGGAQMEYLRTYKGFSEIQEADFFKNIITDYNSLRQQYFSTIENIDLYLEIEEMITKDQYAREVDRYLNGISPKQMNQAADSLLKARQSDDTVAMNKYMKIVFPKRSDLKEALMRKTDSLNIVRLMEITKVHGWQERAWIILWHQRGNHDEDHWVWNYFRPLINKEIEEGKLSRSFWDPFIEEQKLMESLFGHSTPTISNSNTGLKN